MIHYMGSNVLGFYVANSFLFCEIAFMCVDVLMCNLMHDLETIFHLS